MSTAEDGLAARVDAYIASAPQGMREALQHLREAIKAAAPDAVEIFAYGMPGFRYRGRPLLYLAAAKKHYALYGHTPAVSEALGEALGRFEVEKGTIRFKPDELAPADLVGQIVAVRLQEIEAAEAAKEGAGRGGRR